MTRLTDAQVRALFVDGPFREPMVRLVQTVAELGPALRLLHLRSQRHRTRVQYRARRR